MITFLFSFHTITEVKQYNRQGGARTWARAVDLPARSGAPRCSATTERYVHSNAPSASGTLSSTKALGGVPATNAFLVYLEPRWIRLVVANVVLFLTSRFRKLIFYVIISWNLIIGMFPHPKHPIAKATGKSIICTTVRITAITLLTMVRADWWPAEFHIVQSSMIPVLTYHWTRYSACWHTTAPVSHTILIYKLRT